MAKKADKADHQHQSSGLHSPISPEVLHALVHKHFGNHTEVKQYGLLSGGLFNTTYRIQLEHTKVTDVILRLAPERHVQRFTNICNEDSAQADPLFSFERTMMAAEPVVYEHYRQAGIPAPEVLVSDESGLQVPRTYMFMAFIPSLQLDHSSIAEEDKEHLYTQLGMYTAAMHQIEGASFGWPQADGTIRGSNRWSEVLRALADETIKKAAREAYMPGIGEEITAIFEQHDTLFDQIKQPVLVHNDLWEANVLVHGEPGSMSIAAIIDGDRSMFADREYEAILSTNSQAFHAGYGYALDTSSEGEARRLAYRLLSSYFNAYVHKHQVNQPVDGQRYEKRTIELLAQWKRFGFAK
ncbi:aminoglycoside phosphotransferase family protein [Paenibacillus silvae]|uniref:phosphotransferase family protein n=1 Tax=Paenibacillus silvae TaxID=1325358 RepID=UPI0025A1627E|nr:aminoglycoside phosphotransferase family protein [Paenibacillus silvae]MDM5278525.1 aminoglycoside phosphotransferase family protein [Paenibacillus silvae]